MTSDLTRHLEKFQFRGLHPQISIGTASDRYSGWIGQLYSDGRYIERITHRTNTVGGKSFREVVLPVDSLRNIMIKAIQLCTNNSLD